jgi:hypothetical protein
LGGTSLQTPFRIPLPAIPLPNLPCVLKSLPGNDLTMFLPQITVFLKILSKIS